MTATAVLRQELLPLRNIRPPSSPHNSMAQAGHSDTKCHLLALSPELRNRIWHHVLDDVEIHPQARTVELSKDNRITRVFHDAGNSYLPQPALLKVNQQIYSETRPLCIASTTSCFDIVLCSDFTRWMRWWRQLGTDVQYLRKIRLTRLKNSTESPYYEKKHFVSQVITLHDSAGAMTVSVHAAHL